MTTQSGLYPAGGALLIALAAVTSAAAAPAAPGPVLFYGPGDPDPALETRALAAFDLQSPLGPTGPSVRHLGTELGAIATVEILGAEVVACPGAPVGLGAFADGMDRALDHVLYVRVDEARIELERLAGLLPCLTETLPREDLSRIWYLEGVLLGFVSEGDAARESFRRALVVSPELA